MSEPRSAAAAPAAGREVPMRRWGLAAELGRAVAALATGAIPFSTGDVLNIDGGMHIPRLIIDYSAHGR